MKLPRCLSCCLCCAGLALAGCDTQTHTSAGETSAVRRGAAAAESAAASCTADALPGHIVRAMEEGRRMAACFAPHLVTLEQGEAVQARVVALLARKRERAGYKLAAASQQAQRRLAIDGPLTGVLFRDMLLPDGASIPATAGAELIYEADLLAEVGDAAINEARTLEDVARGLRTIIAFLEVADYMMPAGVPNNGPQLLAVNTSARFGVTGSRTAARGDAAFVAALAAMKVTLRSGAGKVLGEAAGAQLLGNPLRAVLHLRDALRRRGERLRPGDLLSLGTFTPPRRVRAGEQVTAAYAIPGAGILRVQAAFE